MAQVIVLKARAKQLAAEDDFTLLFSCGRCDWYAVVDLLSSTLTPLSAGIHEGQAHTSVDWSPVLRMMLWARSQDKQQEQQWLSLSLCTVCAGLAVRSAQDASTHVDVNLVRQVLLEALPTDTMHQGDKQSACVLKLAAAASLCPKSDEVAVSPQILAVHVLDRALQSQLGASIGNGGLWKQLVNSWNAARGKSLSQCQEPKELQLCADIAALLCKASTSSSQQDAVYDALQHVPPGKVSPVASLLVVESLPEPAQILAKPEVQAAACSILGLLVNVTHQCPQVSQCCASHEPLFHLAQTLLCSLRLLAKSHGTPVCDRGLAGLTAFVAPVLCLLINIVEHSTEAGVQLAQMDIPATAVEATGSLQCQNGSEQSCWLSSVNHSAPGRELHTFGTKESENAMNPLLSQYQRTCASMDIQIDMLDDFRVKEDGVLAASSSQSCGMHSAHRHRPGNMARQRSSASSSGNSNSRSRKRHSSTMLQSTCRTSASSENEGNRGSVKLDNTPPKAKNVNDTNRHISCTFLDHLCHRIVAGETYNSVCDVNASIDTHKKDVATDIRSLMGLLAGFLLMVAPQQLCRQVDKLLIGEVQCIVRETLASGVDDSAQSANSLLSWARSKHR